MPSMRSKQAIREEVWKRLEKEGAARFPGARGRIPNFAGAERCAELIAALPEWRKARAIKINPDAPQRAIRYRALKEGKILYMPVPRLAAEKPFIELDPARLGGACFEASSIKGAMRRGRPVSLEEIEPIDLIVCGAVAVNREGARIGKGGGYSDLEYALLRSAGKLAPSVKIVTSVHPLQILEGPLPMTEHDIPVEAFATPTELIRVKPRHRKPRGIYWELLEPEKIAAIPALKRRAGQ
jgi:5-formyltetrahydrofolate cyclo-ligase